MATDTFPVPDVRAMEIVGGRLALDLVNTANWIDGAPVDERLEDAVCVGVWLERVNLSPALTVDLQALRTIRGVVRNLFVDDASPDDVEQHIDDLLTSGALAADDRRILLAFLFSASELYRSDRRDRVRMCPGPRCGWLFVDDSPAGRRRWCSMRACGNRAKAREHYRRTSPARDD